MIDRRQQVNMLAKFPEAGGFNELSSPELHCTTVSAPVKVTFGVVVVFASQRLPLIVSAGPPTLMAR
jgi:hypothetical protein